MVLKIYSAVQTYGSDINNQSINFIPLNTSGVYRIINIYTGKTYIGSSICIKTRLREHLIELRKNNHHSIILQRAWNKYGSHAFKFCILQETNKEKAVSVEQLYINEYNSCNPLYGYNICPNAQSTLGYVHSEETKQKIAEKAMGRKVSDEAKKQMSISRIGKKHASPPREVVERTAAAKRGKKLNISDERREQLIKQMIGNKNLLGYKHTEESRKKMKEKRKGKKRLINEAQAQEIRDLYLEGLIMRNLADLYKCKLMTIRRIVHRQGVYAFGS